MSPAVLSYIVGVMQLLTSACILAKQVLLKPESRNYPTAPRRERVGLWALGAVLGYFGVETLSFAWSGHRFSRPSAGVLAFVWLYASGMEMERVFRQWLPARMQARVQRFFVVASCKAARRMRRARESSNAAVKPGVATGRTNPACIGPTLASLTIEGMTHIAGPEELKGEASVGIDAELQRRFPVTAEGIDDVIPDAFRAS